MTVELRLRLCVRTRRVASHDRWARKVRAASTIDAESNTHDTNSLTG
jgi:hypothetical protein